jgi:hypothetical protein
MKQPISFITRLFRFYYDGFRNMSGWGRKVWVIIIIKLFIMFAILKMFFFQGYLYKNFDNNKDRSEYVLDQLINSSVKHD